MANEPQKTRIYELGDVTSGYMMLDQGAGLPTGKLHTSAYTDEILSKVANTYATQSQLTTGLSGKVDKENGKGLSTNDYTNDDKAVLGSVSGRVEDIEDLIPANASTLNQLATMDDIGAAATGAFKVVSLGPNDEPDVSTPSVKIIYLTKDSSLQVTDPYTEWIWESGANSAWHIIGETTPDLSDYYTKSESDNKFATSAWVDTELDGKVDKVTGMGLSHEDFTSAYKDKIDSIEASAQRNVQSDWEESNSASDSFIKNKPEEVEAIAGPGISIEETAQGFVFSVSGNYVDTSAFNQRLASKMDKSQSADFYPMDTNPSGYLTSDDLYGYATQRWVNELTSSYITSAALSDYATNEYLEDSLAETSSWAEATFASASQLADYYLDSNPSGFVDSQYVTSQVSGKVDKVTGMGLSHEDFTSSYKDKLDSISPSAEQNVQADWSITDSDSDAYIKNKPSIPAAPVQSDWTESNSASLSYIKNKPTTLSIQGGDGIGITESQNSILISVSADYATETYVDSQISGKMDLSMSAEFYPMDTNPSGYLTEHQSLSAYATSAWVEEQGYLTSEDLTDYATKEYVQEETSGKVDKVDGKGLSTNDFTNELLDKLNDIEASAQKNVQSDWEESDTTSDAFIKNKPTPISMKGGEGISVTESQGDLVIAVSADYATESYVDAQVSAKMDKSMSAEFYPYHSNPSGYLVNADLGGYATQTWVGEQGYATEDYVQTQTSGKSDKVSNATQGHLAALSSDGNLLDSTYSPASFATSAQGAKADTAVQDANYVHTDNNYTTTEKNLLASLDSSVSAIEEKIPTNATSQNKLVTKSDLDAAATGAFEVVPLGSNDQPDVAYPNGKTIYLTKDSSLQVTDPYTEWIWLSGTSSFEVIGETTIDLTDYATQNYVLAQTSGKVDKVTGMGLSHVDFTSAYQNKLDSISPSAEVNVQSDWNVTNSALDSYIANKPDILIPQVGTGVSAMPSYIMVVTAMPPASQIDPNTIYLVQGTYIGT